MFGQFLVEPLPELELELEPDDPELEPDELEFELEPELELFELLEVLEDGVVVDALVLALEPVEPVLLVVAASATSAPPATRPVVSAPIAKTLRNRTFMVVALSFRVLRRTRSGRRSHVALLICGRAQFLRSALVGFFDNSMTFPSASRPSQDTLRAGSAGVEAVEGEHTERTFEVVVAVGQLKGKRI